MKISRIYCPTATSLMSDFFSDTPTGSHFSSKTVHNRVFALSSLMAIDKLIIVFIWLFVKGKDFLHVGFFPVKIDGKLRILRCFFTFFFANFWKFIETQGFLIGKIGRICKEMMIFEFFVVFYARKVQLFCAETCGKGCFWSQFINRYVKYDGAVTLIVLIFCLK